MNKIKPVFLLIFSVFFSLLSFSQNLQYTYDSSGNRIKKEIDLNPGQLRKGNPFKDQVGEQIIKIYPNPTTEIVNVDLNEIHDVTTIIRVYDLNGKLIYEKHNLKSNNQINFKENSAGKYIIQIINGKNKSDWVIIKH